MGLGHCGFQGARGHIPPPGATKSGFILPSRVPPVWTKGSSRLFAPGTLNGCAYGGTFAVPGVVLLLGGAWSLKQRLLGTKAGLG